METWLHKINDKPNSLHCAFCFLPFPRRLCVPTPKIVKKLLCNNSEISYKICGEGQNAPGLLLPKKTG